jgi:hypothetical protein
MQKRVDRDPIALGLLENFAPTILDGIIYSPAALILICLVLLMKHNFFGNFLIILFDC